MNRYLRRTSISASIAAAFTLWFFIEGLAFSKESWHSKLLGLLFTPVETLEN